ncbi:MAG TPA: PQQ-dependent sugar dehydrogenase [Gemmatimonadales bacterium]|jgi:glucose/arabinose dehydrogenase
MRFMKLVFGALVTGALVFPMVRPSAPKPTCATDNAGLTLPPGFCALIVADTEPGPRHLVVAPNGDIFVGLARGGVLALRDTNGDGVADVQARFGSGSTTGVALANGFLYYSPNNAVIRFAWKVGDLTPKGPPDTIVKDLPAGGNHRAKSIAVSGAALYVNFGSATNACQTEDRTFGSPGIDPCVERDVRAGIWKFDANKHGQTPADGQHFAAGIRNTVALTVRPDGQLFGVAHGRDQLNVIAPTSFNDTASAEKPSEIFMHLVAGQDYGWPYCYHDPAQNKTVLAPEYGGDGKQVGRCATVTQPLMGFPAHWAPDGITFYGGTQFPAKFRGGAFIAFHGSWNRAPLPQQGYKVVFVPFSGNTPSPSYETFADGFGGANVAVGAALHRPVGLAVGPDGSLYVTDDQSNTGGRIYRIMYRGR